MIRKWFKKDRLFDLFSKVFWGRNWVGELDTVPTDSGYTDCLGNPSGAVAALKTGGYITAWGNSDGGGTGAPTDGGYVALTATGGAFAALHRLAAELAAAPAAALKLLSARWPAWAND